ncbi:hypothetical protein LF41_605 [Lysobacter dokdonensis DS-58]|uniref:Secreted protein n=1 Tax=Lysobacter dokdonensis DS-58 TaxID=1300345 RepID=A0A0A2X026_9GAMM|nr:hypothetical protein [Lysobacter dokdonensis]KGQ18579.1 hypothetical protein LF41_605 [Lysobacter dokdonensis DS-58]
MDRRTVLRPALIAACLGAVLALPALAQEPQTTAAPQTMEQTVEKTATITAVNREKREVTLKNEEGESQTIVVGPEVERFNEISPGDTVRAKYTIGITSELRAATEEEKKDPFVAVEGGGHAPADKAPAAGAGRMFRVVATVEALDRTTQTATLKGPEGNYVTVKVQDPTLLTKPHIGDTVVITAAESVVLSLEKADSNPSK